MSCWTVLTCLSPSCGYIHISDGCWRRNVFVTTSGCWWRYRTFLAPAFKRCKIEIVSPTSRECYQLLVTNIPMPNLDSLPDRMRQKSKTYAHDVDTRFQFFKSYLISRAELTFWSELKISKHFEFLHLENFEALFNDVISKIF